MKDFYTVRTTCDGRWVDNKDYQELYADAMALKRENESLRLVCDDNKKECEATRIQNARLKSKIERLTKLGDELVVCLHAWMGEWMYDDHPEITAWFAEKWKKD